MSRKCRRLAIVAALLIAVVAGSLLASREMLARSFAEWRLGRQTGLRVEIGGLTTDATAGRVEARGFRLFNPAEFGGELLCDVPEFFAEVDPKELLKGRLHFKLLRLNLAELKLVRNAQGAENVARVERAVAQLSMTDTNRAGSRFEFAGIDRMQLSVGRISFRDLRQPTANGEIQLDLRDEVITGIMTEEDLQMSLGGLLFRLIVEHAAKSPGQQLGRKWDWLVEWLRGGKR